MAGRVEVSAALSVENLVVRYGRDVVAVNDISFEVAAGEVVCLLGASGSGKTTLLRTVAGFERATSGTIRVGDETVQSGSTWLAPERRGVGMVFQALELWPHMTVAEHIAFALPGRPRGRRAAQQPTVLQLLARVGLAHAMLTRKPHQLSGGEQQRVAIARTLADDPRVLLFDEPLANLDPHLRQDLRYLMGDLARERKVPALYVTHDPQEALAIGDRIAVLGEGRLHELARPDVLYRRPATLAGARALGPMTIVRENGAFGLALTPAEQDQLASGHVAVFRPEQLRASAAEDGPATVRRSRVAPGGFSLQVQAHDHHGWCSAGTPLPIDSRVQLEILERPALVVAKESA